jgi:hypothetical protein
MRILLFGIYFILKILPPKSVLDLLVFFSKWQITKSIRFSQNSVCFVFLCIMREKRTLNMNNQGMSFIIFILCLNIHISMWQLQKNQVTHRKIRKLNTNLYKRFSEGHAYKMQRSYLPYLNWTLNKHCHWIIASKTYT